MRHSLTLPGYVYLYFLCQSINLLASVISVTVAATVANIIAPNPVYATVPYGMQFLFLLIGTYPVSLLMAKYGRKPGFIIGAVFLLFAGVSGYFALAQSSFALLIVSHGFIGLFSACANFYRYAVTDGLVKSLQSRALSFVVAGGIIAGVLGPTISSQLQDIASFPQFSLCYAILMLLAVINLAVIYFLPDLDKTCDDKSVEDHGVSNLRHLDIIFVAICVAAFSYLLMNALMIQSSLKMAHMNVGFPNSASAIQWHVIAMFFPSFFTGFLIARSSHLTIIFCGIALFTLSFVINIQETSYYNIALSLILLGLGWNFTYVGGSSMLTTALTNNPQKKKWQGIGDTIIAIFATIGAMSPSFLLNTVGWENSNIIYIIMGLIPLLAIFLLKIHNRGTLKQLRL